MRGNQDIQGREGVSCTDALLNTPTAGKLRCGARRAAFANITTRYLHADEATRGDLDRTEVPEVHNSDEWETTTKFVTFRSSAPEVPLPSPEFLEAHFRIAEILQASGISCQNRQDPRSRHVRTKIPGPDGSTDIAALLFQII